MSTKIVAGKLDKLGSMHVGRERVQPERTELKSFYRKAQRELENSTLWFDEAKRRVIANAFGEVISARRYTCFACAVLANHAHLVIGKHRDKAETMIVELRKGSAVALRRLADVPNNHPVWSSDQFKKYLSTPRDIDRTIRYVENNPARSNLPQQRFDFVKPFQCT
ncbi:MAG: hypothetical protein IIA33_10170 [Planctomycetes bacterium]|nr:hypothetical protein [Planctomycetota bacterium]